ncbi:MAG: HD-GYP domain-containing protein [Chloroflexi bacterium]|nr:HD-GYP domain-containing protein [Chloroflexota bacterium]
MQERTSYHFPLRQTVALAAKLIFVGLALGVITLVVSPLAAAIVGCFLLWGALVQTVQTLHEVQDTKASEIADVRRKHNSVIAAMASAIGLKDDMRAGHALRVSDLASIIAQQMQVRPEDVQVIQRATVLADVGKLEIAESILSKEGELNEDEWMEMRRHPELGSRILADVLHLGDAGEIVLAHHERFGGNGYPHGLKGEDIPLGARIYAVADSYIAMTSDRPHRKKMSHDKARREILRSSMTQFDPEVVRAFIRAAEMGLIGPPSESANGDELSMEPFPESKLVESKFS